MFYCFILYHILYVFSQVLVVSLPSGQLIHHTTHQNIVLEGIAKLCGPG